MKKFTSSEAVKYGWRETKKNFWFFACLLAVATVTYYFLSSTSTFGNQTNLLVGSSALAVSLFLNIIVGMGIIHISLKIYDRRKVRYDDIVETAPLFFRYIIASFLYTCIVIAGLVLLIVPGIVWAIKYGFYPFVMIDRNTGVIESLKKSAEITEGAKLELLTLGFLLGLINFAGLIPLGLGLFLSVPIGWMAAVYAYRRLC